MNKKDLIILGAAGIAVYLILRSGGQTQRAYFNWAGMGGFGDSYSTSYGE